MKINIHKIMNIRLKALVASLLLTVFTSCDFTENCVYYGTLRTTLEWVQAKSTISTPADSSMQVLICPLSGEGRNANMMPESYELPFQKQLWVGEYDVFMFNSNSEVFEVKKDGTGSPFIECLTVKQHDKILIKESLNPVYVSVNDGVTIKHEDTTMIICSPEWFVQELEFSIRIKNRINSEVTGIAALLDGVSTGKYLKTGNVTNSYATQDFSSVLKAKETDTYCGSFYMLGIHPVTANLLTLTLSFADKHELIASIDLSDKLKKFVAGKAVITLDIEVGELSADMAIEDWEEVDWGDLD